MLRYVTKPLHSEPDGQAATHEVNETFEEGLANMVPVMLPAKFATHLQFAHIANPEIVVLEHRQDHPDLALENGIRLGKNENLILKISKRGRSAE